MKNLRAVKVYPQDIEKVLPLLNCSEFKQLPRTMWETLLNNKKFASQPEQEFVGIAMVTPDEKYVAFVGVIMTQHTFNGELKTVANISSWIVDKAYRASSLTMLRIVGQYTHFIFTILTPTYVSEKLSKAVMKFECYSDKYQCLAQYDGSSILDTTIYEQEEIYPYLSPADQIIFDDHKTFNCLGVVIQSQDYCVFLLLRKIQLQELNCFEVCYTSSLDVLFRYQTAIGRSLFLAYGAQCVVVDQKLVPSDFLNEHNSLPMNNPRLLLDKDSATKTQPWFNTLYSEYFILDL